jgi:hydroxyethylthiazole kinase-like uncharacterized protein yjeF
MAAPAPPPETLENAPALWAHALPWPNAASHKHERGRLAVMSGPRHKTGAARLAARAGARAGAGWTALFCSPAAADVIAVHETALLIVVRRGPDDWPDAKYGAIVFGPAAGLDEAARADLWALVEARGAPEQALVLDADALTLGAEDPDRFFAATAARKVVLTPHEGEFARLFPDLAHEDRLVATRASAERAGAIIVRKGARTLIAAPGEGAVVANAHATPFLASAGTGDVLAGLIAGLIAQGPAPFLAACAATWIHGEAGRRVGPGLVAEDLLTALPGVLNDLAPEALKARAAF